MKVDELPAGRELDALVAEKVMGWLVRGYESWDTENGNVWREDFQPSIDIKAALDVVSELSKQEWNSVLTGPRHLKGTDFSPGWSVSLGIVDSWENSKSTGETLPLAICRAAFKAVGVSEVQSA